MQTTKKLLAVAIIFVLILSLTHGSGNVSYAETYGPDQNEEKGLISGIVKENNLSLGYLTLYFEDGSGSNPDLFDQLISTRNFTYSHDYITVKRDSFPSDISQIKPGDKVFLKLDADGYIEELGAKSYYMPVYGIVHYIRFNNLVIKRDNGTFISYNISSIPVYKNNRPCSANDIMAGDQVRLLVQADADNIDIACIDIEKVTRPIHGIYRGQAEFYNRFSSSLMVSRVQQFINGRWENAPVMGIQSFSYSKDYTVLPLRRYSGTVYFVTRMDYDGKAKIVKSVFSQNQGYEFLLNDNLMNVGLNNNLYLKNTSAQVLYDENSIIVKDGRLVDISALNTLDPVMLSATKEPFVNYYHTNVLVSESQKDSGINIYRGRISDIEPQRTITVESFARLDGVSWEFTNTPKTFDIDLYTSRLVEANGIGNFRDFGEEYIQQTVYIVELDNKILLLSTAPYADQPVAGRVKSIGYEADASADAPGADAGEGDSGDTEAEPLGQALVLTEASIFSNSDYAWVESDDIEINIPVNAIIIKDGKVGDFKSIKLGENIKVIRHSQNKDGVIILCQ